MRLLTPGPVPVPQTVLKALAEPVLHHRTPEFEQILSQALAQLKKVFGTSQPVHILTGTGTAAMEAAIVNTLSPGDEVLVVVSGKFGERWADMCEVYGIKAHRYNITWGAKLSLDEFMSVVRDHDHVKAVLTQVCETSTATLHPIQLMCDIVKANAPKTLVMVDAITAMGCMDLPMEGFGIDVVVAGSQKAFMLPTGLSFIALSDRAIRADGKAPKYYFNLAAERKANEKNQTMFSTPTPLIKALGIVLNQMNGKGVKKIQGRCELLAQITRDTGAQLGFECFSQSPSSSVTALKVPAGIPGETFRDWLESEKKIVVMGGQDQLKGQIIRVGHMGDISNDDMLALFGALAEGSDHWLKSNTASSKWKTLSSSIESQLKKVDKLFP